MAVDSGKKASARKLRINHRMNATGSQNSSFGLNAAQLFNVLQHVLTQSN